MYRAILLVFLLGLVHMPLMADAGVYELPSYPSFCNEADQLAG